ncbi:Lincomycin resistance protein (plasmid) [Tistrella mobilis KA081020-065]|uniref:Lincomycin resistance protein n=2 Tax=Tistrella mobilis TaxID=171437 RepID=I3TU69_TISMK|nr:Lincomycin resistance protein [Tistrella mobilis KA081020-065]
MRLGASGRNRKQKDHPAVMISTGRQSADRRLLPLLAVTVFFVGATEFMLSSMLAPLADAFDTTPAGAAWLISGYAVAYAIAAPVFGWLSDRVDRGRLLLAGLLLFALDGLAIVLAPTLGVAVALRIFGGIASAILIPTSFALIAEVIPRDRQAGAMGLVMLGMTAGIAFGPAMAGIATDLIGWVAPFVITAAGCAMVFVIGRRRLPGHAPAAARRAEGTGWSWLRSPSILRPLIAKGAWNGTGVAAFLLSGEVLRLRYGFGPAAVGVSVAAFGLGLGLGNLSAGRLRRLFGREELVLVLVTLVLALAITLFMAWSLPLWAALLCLAAWGAALGTGAPAATVVLATRAGPDKAMVLAVAETLNNVAILAAVPLATTRLAETGPAGAMIVLAAGLSVGMVLTLADFRWRRSASAG